MNECKIVVKMMSPKSTGAAVGCESHARELDLII